MRACRYWVLLCVVAFLSLRAFSQNAVAEAVDHSAIASSDQTFAVYTVGAITKPSPGEFHYGRVMKIWQTNGTGWGRSAEYRRRIRGRNFGGLLFSDTPTDATLYEAGEKPYSWPLRRYQFDVLWTHEFAPIHRRVVPYVTSGPGVMLLDGTLSPLKKYQSGWNAQVAFVGGAGGDVRLTRLVTLRAGFTSNVFKASTYSDTYYHSTATIMVEPRIGLVWAFGLPHAQ